MNARILLNVLPKIWRRKCKKIATVSFFTLRNGQHARRCHNDLGALV